MNQLRIGIFNSKKFCLILHLNFWLFILLSFFCANIISIIFNYYIFLSSFSHLQLFFVLFPSADAAVEVQFISVQCAKLLYERMIQYFFMNFHFSYISNYLFVPFIFNSFLSVSGRETKKQFVDVQPILLFKRFFHLIFHISI